MNKLVTTAIIGTGQQATTDLSTGTAVDTLTKNITSEQPERKLLLAAGAWALYLQAGYTAPAPQISQQPALAEQKTVCSSKVAQILSGLLQGKHDVLLSEALEKLQRAQQRLPHDLLPQALIYGTSHKQARTALLPVLGERGHWLAQFSSEWSWATPTDSSFVNKPLSAIEALWQEETLPQRIAILRYVRSVEPDTARAWITSVWKQEKAETRAGILSSLAINLSEKDAAFLEQALDDRSKVVPAQAIQLLSAIPTSAFNQRMQDRADTLFDYTNGSLNITVQNKFAPSWRRDGITQDNKHKAVTPETFLQIISRVSPTHWEEHFGASPVTLVDAANASTLTSDGWMHVLVKGWTIAACTYNTKTWFEPLLHWWSMYADQDCEEYHDLFQHLSQDRAEQYVLSRMFVGTLWMEELLALPQPWTSSFSTACLQTLQQKASELAQNNNDYTYYYKAEELIDALATALPPHCFAIALGEWTFSTDPKENNWYAQYWDNQIQNLKTLLHLRQNILKEIA